MRSADPVEIGRYPEHMGVGFSVEAAVTQSWRILTYQFTDASCILRYSIKTSHGSSLFKPDVIIPYSQSQMDEFKTNPNQSDGCIARCKAILATYFLKRLQISGFFDIDVLYEKFSLVRDVFKFLVELESHDADEGRRAEWTKLVERSKRHTGNLAAKIVEIDQLLARTYVKIAVPEIELGRAVFSGVRLTFCENDDKGTICYYQTATLFGVPKRATFNYQRAGLSELAQQSGSLSALDQARVQIALYLLWALNDKMYFTGNFSKRFDDICFAFRLLQKLQEMQELPADLSSLSLDSRFGTLARYLHEVQRILSPASGRL